MLDGISSLALAGLLLMAALFGSIAGPRFLRSWIAQRDAATVRRVLRQDRLTIVFQPTVDVRAGRIVSCEALLRLRDGAGLVSAIGILQAAENARLGHEIACFVLDQVHAARDVLGGIPVTINTTPADLKSPAVRAAIAACGATVNVEILETAFAGGDPELAAIVAELRREGVKIYLDDFGVGYSSLTHFVDLPIDVLKIDRSFVLQLTESEKHRTVCRTIIQMADSCGIETIAEGVESADQLAAITDLGCAKVQGFLFYRPLTADQLAAVLTESPPPAQPLAWPLRVAILDGSVNRAYGV